MVHRNAWSCADQFELVTQSSRRLLKCWPSLRGEGVADSPQSFNSLDANFEDIWRKSYKYSTSIHEGCTSRRKFEVILAARQEEIRVLELSNLYGVSRRDRQIWLSD